VRPRADTTDGDAAVPDVGALRLRPVAVRPLGDDILVARPGPDLPVHRLTGSGPTLWRLFEAGATVDEASLCIAEATGARIDDVRRAVVEFAGRLVAMELAEPA
jgi:hypothetical protein